MTKEEYAAYQKAVAEFFYREGIQNLSTGRFKCPVCDEDTLGEEDCPHCGENLNAWNEPAFSSSPCECCGRPEGGDRYYASGFNPDTEEIHEFNSPGICPDCVYYAEYGQLDDMTMFDIED